MLTPSHPQHPQRIHYLAVAALLLFFCLFAESSSPSSSSSLSSSSSFPPADDTCTSNRWVVVSVSASDNDVPTREQLREHYRGLRGWCLVVVLGSDAVPSYPNDDDHSNAPALELDAQSAPSPHGRGGAAVAPAASRRGRRRQISRHRRHATAPLRGYDASGELVAINHAASSVECGEDCLDRT